MQKLDRSLVIAHGLLILLLLAKMQWSFNGLFVLALPMTLALATHWLVYEKIKLPGLNVALFAASGIICSLYSTAVYITFAGGATAEAVLGISYFLIPIFFIYAATNIVLAVTAHYFIWKPQSI